MRVISNINLSKGETGNIPVLVRHKKYDVKEVPKGFIVKSENDELFYESKDALLQDFDIES